MRAKSYDFTIDCPIPPTEVFRAMTDFSEKRTRYFPNLSRAGFKVLELTENSARVEEGTGPFVTEEHYRWTAPNRIWSVVERSNVFVPGGLTDIHIDERSDGGTHVTFHIERQFRTSGLGGLLRLSLAMNGRGYFRKPYTRMLRNVIHESRKPGAD